MSTKKNSLIELKGAMLPVLSVILRSLDLEKLRKEAQGMFGDEAFFEGDLAALDLGHLEADDFPLPAANWSALRDLFAGYGLRVIGIKGGSPALAASAGEAGLLPVAIAESSSRPQPAAAPTPDISSTPAAAAAQPQPKADTVPAAPPSPPAPANTLIIDRPLRSGQQVYARGGDVIVLAVVSTGAEVIADGSIHIYAPLRGRALAGANGNNQARIFTTRMEAELVSVAGIYRTFEDGVPAQLQGKPTQIRLVDDSASGNPRLVVEALAIG